MPLLLVGADDTVGAGLAEGAGSGLLFGLGAPGPGAVSLHCCQSQANPSKIGLRGAGGGGGGVVVRLAFGVTTTWLSKAASRSCSSKELAVVGPKPCSFSKAASNASLLLPYSVLREIGARVASDTIPVG